MRNHCVFYRTNLKYDGRVCAMIKTLAESFPEDTIYLYEYPVNSDYYDDFPPNVRIIKSKLFFKKKSSRFITKIWSFMYAINSFNFLMKKRPKTIQAHHEVTNLGVLLFKLLFKKTILVYDDKEMYHVKDKNISLIYYIIEYFIIKLSNLIIVTNTFRYRALNKIHNNNLKNYIIVDNFVFEPYGRNLSKNIISKIVTIKSRKKILIHQGEINKIRGIERIEKLVYELPDDWILAFIGISNRMFESFVDKIDVERKSKIYNFGYINYNELNSFYQYVDGALILYLPTTFNNNYCAPNRLYSAVNNGVPIIVNSDNYTLSTFVKNNNNGVSIKSCCEVKNFFENYELYIDKSIGFRNKYQYNNKITELGYYYKSI